MRINLNLKLTSVSARFRLGQVRLAVTIFSKLLFNFGRKLDLVDNLSFIFFNARVIGLNIVNYI